MNQKFPELCNKYFFIFTVLLFIWPHSCKGHCDIEINPYHPLLSARDNEYVFWGIYLSGECEQCVSASYPLLLGNSRCQNSSCNSNFQHSQDIQVVLLWVEIYHAQNVREPDGTQ